MGQLDRFLRHRLVAKCESMADLSPFCLKTLYAVPRGSSSELSRFYDAGRPLRGVGAAAAERQNRPAESVRLSLGSVAQE